ncbi:MAG: M48 family metalloprotease [Alphaproteobacteria bacterium]|nr:M48 family metalloprotease [Alphaproteobacteria bacterium]
MSEAPVPPERTTFYHELVRRRRAAWVVATVCILVSAGVGLVLSTIVTPIVLLGLGGLLKLIAMLGVVDSLADGGLSLIRDFVSGQLANFDRLSETLDRVKGSGDMRLLAGPLLRLMPAALPALFAGAVVWLWLRALFARVGSDDLVLRLKARPVRPDDFEERQLANVVEEVAIGAGAPAPAVLLVDAPSANAAAVGSSKRGVVIFTRGLLDRLDRSETEAIAARLICTIGAGDLQAAAGIMGVLRTLGFFLTVLDLPLRGSAWRTLGGLLLVSLPGRRVADALGRIGEGLEEGLQTDAIPDLDQMAKDMPSLVGKLVRFLLLPFYLLSVFYKLILFLWTALFLGPPMALLWRNRCYWTDARTVQLARDPEAFAKALEKIGAADPPDGGEAFAYLFVAAPTSARRAIADRRTLAMALTPPTTQRLARLAAMGASPRGTRTIDLRVLFAHPARAAVLGALGLLLVPLFVALFGAIGFLTVMVMTFGLLAGLGIVHALI